MEADVIGLSIAYDVDQLYQKRRLIPENWQSLLPNNSCPYTSTMVFLVRKGNPLGIKDWDDLVKTDVSIITPNPKISGAARYNFLAAWGYALKHNNNDEAVAKDFVNKLFKNTAISLPSSLSLLNKSLLEDNSNKLLSNLKTIHEVSVTKPDDSKNICYELYLTPDSSKLKIFSQVIEIQKEVENLKEQLGNFDIVSI